MMLSQNGAKNLHRRNIMRTNHVTFARTIVSSTGAGAAEDSVTNGNRTDEDFYTHPSNHGSSVSATRNYEVTFTRPVTVVEIGVYNIRCDGQNGIDIFNQGSRSVTFNAGSIWSAGVGSTSYTETTVRTGCTSVAGNSHGECNGGDWTAEAQAGISEIEVYAVI